MHTVTSTYAKNKEKKKCALDVRLLVIKSNSEF